MDGGGAWDFGFGLKLRALFWGVLKVESSLGVTLGIRIAGLIVAAEKSWAKSCAAKVRVRLLIRHLAQE